MKLRALTFIILTSLLYSCAHRAPRQDSQLSKLTPEQLEQVNREALALASERLKMMVIEARQNEDARRYLATDLFLKANMSLMEGDFTTASVLFDHLADLVPEDEFVQKKQAVTLIRIGDLERARQVLAKLYGKSKDDKVGLILAGVYTGLDQESEARKLYQELLAANPRNEDACIFLSKSYAMGKETSRAEQLLKTCAEKNPKNGMYDYYLGKIHLDSDKMELAAKDFERSLSRQPSLSQSVLALGLIYEEKEQFDAALTLYKKHLKKKPSNITILTRLVHVLFLKEKFDEVIPHAERLADLEPDNLNLKVKLGILYTDARKYKDAISIFRDLLVVAPQSDKILYYLGAIHQELKEWHSSIEYFNQIPSSSGLYSDSSLQMANMLSTLAQEEHVEMKGEEWKEAFLKHINDRSQELKDQRVDLAVIKAGFFEAVGQHRDAMETMMVVQDDKGFSIQHKYYLANLYEREQKYDESTALIMTILEKEPKNAHAWNFLGYSLLVRGEKLDEAYSYIKKAHEISPEDGYIRDSLGWYYYKTGNVKKALRELEYAFKQVPDDVEILKHLAIVHQELKDYTKARNYLETALKHARFHFDRSEIQSQLEALESSRIPASDEID